MARYRPVYVGIWDDEDEFLEYSDAQKVLFFYLITNDNCTVSGISKISYRKVSAVLGWSIEKLKKTLCKLEPNVYWDADTNMVFVKNFLKYNGLKHGNPNFTKPSIDRESDLYCTSLWHWFNLSYPNLLVTYSKPSEGLSNSNSNSNYNSNPIKAVIIDEEHVLELYNLYPKKKARDEALKAIRKALKSNKYETIKEGLLRYIEERKGKDPKYTKYPATWFNKGCWYDEPETQTQGVNIGAIELD